MSTISYAKGITAEDLRIFLQLLPIFSSEADEVQQMLIEDKDKLLGKGTMPFSWCYLYELSNREHLNLAITGIVQNLDGLLSSEQVADWFKQLTTARNQLVELPNIITKIDQHFDTIEDPSKEHVEKLRLVLADIVGKGKSMFNTLRCVLYHGCFLNELIERVRAGDDKALFDAVRIDPTVIGCISVSNRISKAALFQDNRFFAKLKAAINGKMAKREQANFQKMRLVLEVLHEAGAIRLNDDLLHQLFVEELNLYGSNAKGGGSAKALRKFADTYMKKDATT